MSHAHYALIYATLCGLPVIMHIGLIAGRAWGRYTMGGRYPGRLPARSRVASGAQAVVLLAMAVVVLDRGGVIALSLPAPVFWVVLALTIVTNILNIITPSAPERRLWGPVTTGMSAAILALALL